MRVRWKPGSGVATPLMNTGRTGDLIQPAEQELQWLGEPVVHLHTVRNGKIDPALHDGMRTGLRQLHRHWQLSCRTAEITNCRRSNA